MTQRNAFCDGLQRRSLLRIGVMGLFGTGLSLGEILARQARAAELGKAPPRATSVIILFLRGGLSTIDTWDLKPDAPAEFRGPYSAIDTSLPGIRFCEHLPLSARQLDKFSLVRSFGHRDTGHEAAQHYILTGYLPLSNFNPTHIPNNHHPAHGSIISRRLGARGSVPPYVCLPRMPASASSAYLGAAAAPLVVESDPNSPNFSVRDLTPPLEIRAERLSARSELRAEIDRFEKTGEIVANRNAHAVQVFQQKAFDLMTSSAARKAFDLHEEPDKLRDAYGRNTLGQSCLMARRLVEAGVRCVTIDHVSWDTHDNNFTVLKNDLLPLLDLGMSALLTDLADRGRLDSTLVVVTGEFGRTPRINPKAGRDHWSAAFTVALAGGGVQAGRVIGKSDARAERPVGDFYGPEDLSATMYRLLGISPEDEFHTPEGRPIKIANNGRTMSELL